jgi:hypothetical protein
MSSDVPLRPILPDEVRISNGEGRRPIVANASPKHDQRVWKITSGEASDDVRVPREVKGNELLSHDDLQPVT